MALKTLLVDGSAAIFGVLPGTTATDCRCIPTMADEFIHSAATQPTTTSSDNMNGGNRSAARLRRILCSLALLMVGGIIGYLVAYWTGAPVPHFVQRARFSAIARIDEAHLRAALTSTERAARYTSQTIARGGWVAASASLAQAIRFSRAQALKGRTHHLSAEMKALYAPYFPDEILERVRWKLADGRPGLGSLLAGWYYREGAVTLGDVIVYSSMKAATHKALVAHELTHVLQYEQLGTDDFARLYTANWMLIESQARRNAQRIIADIEQKQDTGAQAMPASG